MPLRVGGRFSPRPLQQRQFLEWLGRFAGKRVIWQITDVNRPMWATREVVQVHDPWHWYVGDQVSELGCKTVFFGSQAWRGVEVVSFNSSGLDYCGFATVSALCVDDDASALFDAHDNQFDWFEDFLHRRGFFI